MFNSEALNGEYLKRSKKRFVSVGLTGKCKAIAQKLEQQGIMSDYGRAKIEEAKKNGGGMPRDLR